jgi:pentatricopeptide repeat protein
MLLYSQERGDLPKAEKQLEQLAKLEVPLTWKMFSPILHSYVEKNDPDKVKELWHRMHREGIELSKEVFTTMVRHCTLRGQPERAFFLLDEMECLEIEPDEEFFCHLLRAAGKAPVWVHGYQDTVFDALYAFEGRELLPNQEVYNSIIAAFSECGDATAAEFYYWEMRRKGISPNTQTYFHLLAALIKAQSLGASAYKTKGRFVRTPKELTREEQDIVDAGAEEVAKICESIFCHQAL